MNTNQMITGTLLRDMLVSASNAVSSHKQEINELNVFPVPDGDTGTNMSMTMNSAAREMQKHTVCTLSEVAETAASSLLRGARGNSGVILSLLFRGIAKEFKGKTAADGMDLSIALQLGVEAAYNAVMKPAEGTILTVAREAAAAAQNAAANGGDVTKVLEAADIMAKQTLIKTPEMLPVLKKAGVVDSGGKGFTIILDAMLQALRGNGIANLKEDDSLAAQPAGAVGQSDEKINFTYCTEFIINKNSSEKKDPLTLRAYLESIGDCVLVADESTFIKVHCHTDNPDRAIHEALTFGFLTDIKIDNMRVQHEEKVSHDSSEPAKPVGFVTVSAGDGIAALFKDLGADKVVEGGQTMNPSTDDILKAIQSVNAKTIIVLPNNKNIILAAEQAVSLANGNVRVLHTKTIPQGITAMLNFNPDETVDANLLAMESAAAKVKSGFVTFAARDSDFDGRDIKKDEILALSGGKILFTERDPVKAAVKLTKNLSDKSTSYITLIYGQGVTDEQANAARDELAHKLSSQVEINVINGGQPIYHFIISVE